MYPIHRSLSHPHSTELVWWPGIRVSRPRLGFMALEILTGFRNPKAASAESPQKMAVRIRLARFGCRNRPFYRLMAADSKSLRDGRHLEVLGFYDPLSGEDGVKRTGLKVDRVKYWLSVGAQPSEPVERILRKAGILPLEPMPAATHKSSLETMSGLFPTPECSEDGDEQEMPQSLPLCLGVPLSGHADCDLKIGPEV